MKKIPAAAPTATATAHNRLIDVHDANAFEAVDLWQPEMQQAENVEPFESTRLLIFSKRDHLINQGGACSSNVAT